MSVNTNPVIPAVVLNEPGWVGDVDGPHFTQAECDLYLVYENQYDDGTVATVRLDAFPWVNGERADLQRADITLDMAGLRALRDAADSLIERLEEENQK